jgi:hypothetical protein
MSLLYLPWARLSRHGGMQYNTCFKLCYCCCALQIQYALGNYLMARKYFSKAVDLNPKNMKALWGLHEVRLPTKRRSEQRKPTPHRCLLPHPTPLPFAQASLN